MKKILCFLFILFFAISYSQQISPCKTDAVRTAMLASDPQSGFVLDGINKRIADNKAANTNKTFASPPPGSIYYSSCGICGA